MNRIGDFVYRIRNYIYKLFCTPESYARFLGVTVGTGCSIATKGFSREGYLITIGDNVQITEGVKLYTHGGGWVLRSEYPDFDSFGKITIGNNVYIGNNAMIMPGVTIGNNVVVGGGTVVTKSIPDNVVIAGSPARIVKNMSSYKDSLLPYNLRCKSMGYDEKKRYLLSLPDDAFVKKTYLNK